MHFSDVMASKVTALSSRRPTTNLATDGCDWVLTREESRADLPHLLRILLARLFLTQTLEMGGEMSTVPRHGKKRDNVPFPLRSHLLKD